MQEPIIEYYQSRISSSRIDLQSYSRQINVYSILRLASVLFWGFAIYQSLGLEIIWITELAFLLPIFVFVYFVGKQSYYEKLKQYAQDVIAINENELNSIASKENIYLNGEIYVDDLHLYTSDLDIFGRKSLFSLMNRCATIMGNNLLASWLCEAAGRIEIIQRQDAIKELSTKSDWRQHFQAVLFFNKKSETDHIVPMITAYLKQPAGFISSGLAFYIKWLPLLILPLIVLSFFFANVIFAIVFISIVNLFIVQAKDQEVERTEALVGKVGTTLSKYSDVIKAIETEQWNSDLCKELSSKIGSIGQGSMSAKIKQLSKHISILNLCSGQLTGFLLKTLLLLNVRQHLAIEDWKRKNHQDVAHIFDVIASFEALISISSLSFNFQDWCFPEILDDTRYSYIATGLGHPLILKTSRVLNNYNLNDALKIDIITGSNMAGKSTFLRTLGINAVLAFCGSPVCAQKMQITTMTIFSYMRIKDSLNESTSTFKAELDRLRLLLTILRREKKVFFLIDEMLRGTNSVDKYRGSKAVIEKLISENAVGTVATHDLQLAHLEQKYPNYIRNFYFDIQVLNEEMLFDYKLKEGECKTFNASLLLKKLGIEVDAN